LALETLGLPPPASGLEQEDQQIGRGWLAELAEVEAEAIALVVADHPIPGVADAQLPGHPRQRLQVPVQVGIAEHGAEGRHLPVDGAGLVAPGLQPLAPAVHQGSGHLGDGEQIPEKAHGIAAVNGSSVLIGGAGPAGSHGERPGGLTEGERWRRYGRHRCGHGAWPRAAAAARVAHV